MDFTMLLWMFIPFTIEIIIGVTTLIKHPLKFRFKPYISIPVGLLICFASTFLVILGFHFFVKPEQWNEILNIVAYTIPMFGIFFGFLFAYKIKWNLLLLMSSVSYTFQAIAYHFNILIFDTGIQMTLYNNLGQEWYMQNWSTIYNILSYINIAGVYVTCYFLIAKPFAKYSKHIIKTIQIIILGVVVYFVVNIANVFIVQHVSTNLWYDGALRGVLSGVLIVFCLLFNILVVGGFKVVEHREEAMMIQMTLNSKIREQEMTENNINFINMKCHDLRKELRRLKEQKGNLKDEDFCMLEESLNFYDSSVKTGNVNIDALIQDKLIYCNSLGIELTTLIDGDAFKKMDASDAYFLLINIIDNAIEAVEHIDDKEKRAISLTASQKQGILVIEETNYFVGDIKFNNDGSIKTTKSNSKYHGYGTKSIAYIAKKYDGNVTYDVKDGIFVLKVVL